MRHLTMSLYIRSTLRKQFLTVSSTVYPQIPPNGALHTKAVSRRERQGLAEALRPKATGPIQGGAHRTTSLSAPLTSLGCSDDDPTVSTSDPGPSSSGAPVSDCPVVVGYSVVDLRFTHAAGIWPAWTDVVVVLSELSAVWSLCLCGMCSFAAE